MVRTHNIFSTLLDTIGDESGITNANSDFRDTGLGKTGFFKTVTGENDEAHIHKLIVNYTGMNLAIDGYGSEDALVNGIQIALKDEQNNILIDFTAGESIKTNNDWSRLTDNVQLLTYKSLMQSMSIALDFTVFGDIVKLVKGLKFSVEANDDLSDLTLHTFLLYGKILNNTY